MTVGQFLESFPLAVVGVDGEGRVAVWNDAAARLLGWSSAEVLGKPDPSLAGEQQRVTRDGKLLDVTLINATDGEHALAIISDVTERVARENQFRLMLEQLPAVISILNEDLVFVSSKGAGLRPLNMDPDTLVGVCLPELIGEDTTPVRSIRAALRGESSTNEYEFQGRWYENRAEPLQRRDDGAVTSVVNLGFDITERRRAEAEVRRISAAMNKIQEEERRRIAREVHDELGQLITAVRLNLGVMQRELPTVPTAAIEARIGAMADLVDLTIKTMQRVATELRPRVLDDFGLRAALKNETAAFSERTGIDVRLTIRGEESIDTDSATAIYRIVMEGLTNVARHAGATRVDVRVEAGDGRIEAELRDNGRGITAADVNQTTALGLLGVRERAYALGGQAVIEAIPGQGTRVFVSLPQ